MNYSRKDYSLSIVSLKMDLFVQKQVLVKQLIQLLRVGLKAFLMVSLLFTVQLLFQANLSRIIHQMGK